MASKLDQLCLLADAEAWVAAGRDVVDGTLPDAPEDETATGLAAMFVEELKRGISCRERWRVFQAYVTAFLDASKAFQAA